MNLPLSPDRLEAAYQTALAALLAERTPEGHWVGELSTSALSTATAVSALSLVQKHTGSSAHIHISLWGEDGKNTFPGDRLTGPVEASDTFRWFLGGWMRHARAFAAFYAPYVASY